MLVNSVSVAERLIAPVLKTGGCNRSEGSNPSAYVLYWNIRWKYCILSCSGSQCRPVTTSISDFDCSIIVHFCKSRTYVFSCKSVVLQLTCERLTRRIMCGVTTHSTIYSPTRESLGSMMDRIVWIEP